MATQLAAQDASTPPPGFPSIDSPSPAPSYASTPAIDANGIIHFRDQSTDSENQRCHITYIFFQVGNSLFKAPEYRFASAAPGLLVARTVVLVEGRSRFAFVLEDVEHTDFVFLLNYFYPQNTSAPSKAELISVLKIATQYKAKSLRTEAIDQLEHLGLSWVDRAWLGRECFVAEWFRSGYTDMLKSEVEDCISNEAIEKLSLAGVVRACGAKESLYPPPTTLAKQRPLARTASENLAHEISSEFFKEELDNLAWNASNPVEDFWVALMFGQRDRLESIIGVIAKRPESLTCDEVKGHEHQRVMVQNMLRSRLRYKERNGRPSKDVQSAFKNEFGEELENISRQDQELGSQQLSELTSSSQSTNSGNWNEAAKTLPLIICLFIILLSVLASFGSQRDQGFNL